MGVIQKLIAILRVYTQIITVCKGPIVKQTSNVTDLQVSGGISLLSVDEIGEEHGVSDEEDGGVVPHEVPVPFVCVKLHCKTSRVPRCIC